MADLRSAWTFAPLLVTLAACGDSGRESASASEATTIAPPVTTTTTGATETTAPLPTTGTPTGTQGDSDAGTTAVATTMSVEPTTGGLKFDLGVQPDVGAGCGGGGDVEVSYIWVANSAQGTISKINTVTMIEEGRYRVRPDSQGSPSRTSVNLSGDVAVANRLGGVAKVYARTSDCQDTNGTPGIQTSTGAGDILDWGVEECVAWYTPFDFTTQRPLAWSQGTFNRATCKYEGQRLWTVGAQNNRSGSVITHGINGDTGAVEVTIPMPEIAIGYYGPYGAAVDAEGDFWFVDAGNDGPDQELVRVNAADNTYDIWKTPAGLYPYGFAVDTKGRPWIAGYQGGIARFDPITETFEVNPAYNGLGIQEDAQGRMWIARYPWVQPETVYALDRDTMQFIKEIQLPSNLAKGISIDFFGKVWVVDQGTSAFRVDPDSGTFDVYSGLTGPYTYSDMTGWGLSSVSNPQG